MRPATVPEHADLEVIIPAYNAEPFLAETLDSVLNQSRPPRLISVVNDRSKDGTAAVVRAYGEEPRPGVRLRLLDNTGPQGPSAARNTALRNAQGPAWVAFQDADDLMLPGQIESLFSLLARFPSAVLAFGDTEIFNAERTLQPSLLRETGALRLPPQAQQGDGVLIGPPMTEALCVTGVFGTSACVLRRDLVLQLGAFDETMMYGEDTDLFLRLSRLGPFAGSPQLISRKRTHGNNLTDPRNHVHFGRGRVRTLGKQLGLLTQPGESPAPDLDRAQQARLRQHLQDALDGYLWHASVRGGPVWQQARELAVQIGYGQDARNLRHHLRAHVHSLRRAWQRWRPGAPA